MMFVAGNLVEIVNLRTFEHKYLRSTSGGGVGALIVSYPSVVCSCFASHFKNK